MLSLYIQYIQDSLEYDSIIQQSWYSEELLTISDLIISDLIISHIIKYV